MQKDEFIVDPAYNGPKVLECFVEKYKKTGSFTMLTGTKQKKFFILDLVKKEFRYQTNKESSNKAKSISFSDINKTRIDLSKPNKYYLEVLSKQRLYKFKFLIIDSWILFTKALSNVKCTTDQSRLFEPNEGYNEILRKYEENTGLPKDVNMTRPSQLHEERLHIDQTLAEPTNHKVATKGEKTLIHDEPQTIAKSSNTSKVNDAQKVKVTAKKIKFDSESENSVDDDKQPNEIIKKRKNV